MYKRNPLELVLKLMIVNLTRSLNIVIETGRELKFEVHNFTVHLKTKTDKESVVCFAYKGVRKRRNVKNQISK